MERKLVGQMVALKVCQTVVLLVALMVVLLDTKMVSLVKPRVVHSAVLMEHLMDDMLAA